MAKALYLCEEYEPEGGLLNLYGLFHRLPAPSFPHTRDELIVSAQLSGGLGDMVVHIDVRATAGYRLIGATSPRTVRFERRTQLIQLAHRLEGVTFPAPGVYLAELYCDNAWVADVSFEVVGGRAMTPEGREPRKWRGEAGDTVLIEIKAALLDPKDDPYGGVRYGRPAPRPDDEPNGGPGDATDPTPPAPSPG